MNMKYIGLLVFVNGLLACGTGEVDIASEDIEQEIDARLEEATSIESASEMRERLSGTWAVLITDSTVVTNTPPSGKDTIENSLGWYRLERMYDADENVFVQSFKMCGGRVLDTSDTQSEILETAFASIPEFSGVTTRFNYEAGTLQTENLVDLWGITLDDPVNDVFPQSKDEAEAAPFADSIYDMDEDGQTGARVRAAGMNIDFILRRILNLSGRVVYDVDNDRVHVFGLTEHVSRDNVNLRADGTFSTFVPDVMEHRQNRDARTNYFEQIRLTDGASCDDVKIAIEDGNLFCDENPYVFGKDRLDCFMNSIVGGTGATDEESPS